MAKINFAGCTRGQPCDLHGLAQAGELFGVGDLSRCLDIFDDCHRINAVTFFANVSIAIWGGQSKAGRSRERMYFVASNSFK